MTTPTARFRSAKASPLMATDFLPFFYRSHCGVQLSVVQSQRLVVSVDSCDRFVGSRILKRVSLIVSVKTVVRQVSLV